MDRIYRLYSFARKTYKRRIPILPNLIRVYMRLVYACDVPFTAQIGIGTRFPHNGLGIVIHNDAIIGENCTIYQNVTIGGNGKEEQKNGIPIIGDNVFIGAGAVLIGPIKIGDNSKIGSNAVVLGSVPENCVSVGVPAKIVKEIKFDN